MIRVSRQLAKGRTAGKYSNYGERLYAEGLMELEKKRVLVGCLLILSTYSTQR